jgi:hypothetical protein
MTGADFAIIMPAVARSIWGEPNARLSTKSELRWGSHGSRCVDIVKGTFFYHEANEGGGVLDLLKREGLGPEWLREHGYINGEDRNEAASHIVAKYDYTDENGELVYQAVRFEPKKFLQRRPDPDRPGEWLWNLKGTTLVPYRLAEVLEAIALERPIFIPEGEKDVETLRRHGLDATCNSGGAGKWRAEFADHFAGADVVILPDNDDAGRAHADAVARSLTSKAARVRILALPGLEPKGDVSDWFSAGGKVEQFNALVEKAANWQPTKEADAVARITATPFRLRDVATMPARQVLYRRHLYRKFVSMTVGPGGSGKSKLSITDALAMTSGKNLCGNNIGIQKLRVWLWNLEDPEEELDRRIHAACQRFGITEADLGGRLFRNSGRNQPCILAKHTFADGAYIVAATSDGIIDEIKARGIDVLIIDPVISSHRVPENDNGAIDVVVKEWGRIADVCNCAIELYAHTRKLAGENVSTESARGGKAFTDAARSVRVINRMTPDEGL